MARPISHDDLPDYQKTRRLADFTVDSFANNPELLQAYASFLRAAAKIGAETSIQGTVTAAVPEKELDELLASAQRNWDSLDKRYHDVNGAYKRGELDMLSPKWQDYEKHTLRNHAQREGYRIFGLIEKDA